MSWHAAQDQPKWAHEWNTCQRTRKNARNSPFGNFHAENTNTTISGRRLDVLQVMLQFPRYRCSQVDDSDQSVTTTGSAYGIRTRAPVLRGARV